jgi:hypothetical protein
MTMIRNALFGLSLLALGTGSALAAPAKHVAAKPRTVAEASAPAGDTAAPAGDKADKKTKKSTKKDKAPKGEKTEGAKEMKAPAPATK